MDVDDESTLSPALKWLTNLRLRGCPSGISHDILRLKIQRLVNEAVQAQAARLDRVNTLDLVQSWEYTTKQVAMVSNLQQTFCGKRPSVESTSYERGTLSLVDISTISAPAIQDLVPTANAPIYKEEESLQQNRMIVNKSYRIALQELHSVVDKDHAEVDHHDILANPLPDILLFLEQYALGSQTALNVNVEQGRSDIILLRAVETLVAAMIDYLDFLQAIQIYASNADRLCNEMLHLLVASNSGDDDAEVDLRRKAEHEWNKLSKSLGVLTAFDEKLASSLTATASLLEDATRDLQRYGAEVTSLLVDIPTPLKGAFLVLFDRSLGLVSSQSADSYATLALPVLGYAWQWWRVHQGEAEARHYQLMETISLAGAIAKCLSSFQELAVRFLNQGAQTELFQRTRWSTTDWMRWRDICSKLQGHANIDQVHLVAWQLR